MAKKVKQTEQLIPVEGQDANMDVQLGSDLSVRTCGHLCQGAFDPPFSMKLCDPCGGWGCGCPLCAERTEGAGV